ncbi:Hpt domain-containing response regulator [Thermomonas sp.]|uniref:response regulator n=1 Tax=Thermomonas sp. TaxID=1971895 RepID=UPI003D14AECA
MNPLSPPLPPPIPPSSPPPATPPRLLLVEDDPASAAFMAAVASALPARVHLVASIADGESACALQGFDLLLVDANLPDGRGEHLLHLLRERGHATPALAHTADPDPALHARLRAAGFAEVLLKPIAAAALRAALRRHLPGARPADWDDAAALAALGGEAAHVQALRALFLAELPQQRQRIVHAAIHADIGGLRAELHRLVASCGFVGAARLGSAVRALQDSLLDAAALRAVEAAIDELLASAATA